MHLDLKEAAIVRKQRRMDSGLNCGEVYSIVFGAGMVAHRQKPEHTKKNHRKRARTGKPSQQVNSNASKLVF